MFMLEMPWLYRYNKVVTVVIGKKTTCAIHDC